MGQRGDMVLRCGDEGRYLTETKGGTGQWDCGSFQELPGGDGQARIPSHDGSRSVSLLIHAEAKQASAK